MHASPSDPTSGPRVEHDAANQRFRVTVDGHTGVVEYRLADGVMRLTHTAVAPAIERRGLAAALVREALAHARRAGLKVEPLCSYAAAYMRRHPQTHDLLP